MAAMTRYVDNLPILRDFVQALGMVELDTVVNMGPEPFEESGKDTNRLRRNIRCDFFRVFACVA